jgi:hypothetical protein
MCDKITIDEIAAVAGAPVTLGENTDPNRCIWNIGDPSEIVPDVVAELRLDSDLADLSPGRTVWPGGEDIAIANGAYWAPDVNVLWFIDADNTYAVQLVGMGDSAMDNRAIAVAMATAAANRI